jgi:hypothetical protein
MLRAYPITEMTCINCGFVRLPDSEIDAIASIALSPPRDVQRNESLSYARWLEHRRARKREYNRAHPRLRGDAPKAG